MNNLKLIKRIVFLFLLVIVLNSSFISAQTWFGCDNGELVHCDDEPCYTAGAGSYWDGTQIVPNGVGCGIICGENGITSVATGCTDTNFDDAYCAYYDSDNNFGVETDDAYNSCFESDYCYIGCCCGVSVYTPGYDANSVCYGGACFDDFGSEATTNKAWSHGQEYSVLSFDDSGKLIKEINRYYSTLLFASSKFGDVKREVLYPLTDLEVRIRADDTDFEIENFPDYNKNAFGVASGTLRVDKIEVINYDFVGRGKYTLTSDYYYDGTGVVNAGLPSKVVTKNKDLFDADKSSIDKMEYLAETDASARSKHMLAQPKSTERFETSEIDSNREHYLEPEYESFDGRYFMKTVKEWQDEDNDGVVDADELFWTEKVLEYNNFGQPVKIEKANGVIIETVYNQYSLPLEGYDSNYGSKAIWKKTYNSDGTLNSATNINGKTTNYYYDARLRLEKVVVGPDDTISSPTIIYSYSEYLDSAHPKFVKKETKLAEGKYAVHIEFSDGFGRVVQIQDKRDDNTYLVQAVKFDSFGRKWREYKPYYTNTGGQYQTTVLQGTLYTQYDYYPESGEKIWQKIMPGGGTIEYLYGSTSNGLPTITMIDEEGDYTRYTYDLMGRLLKVEQKKK